VRRREREAIARLASDVTANIRFQNVLGPYCLGIKGYDDEEMFVAWREFMEHYS
jgi:hypothetical protein